MPSLRQIAAAVEGALPGGCDIRGDADIEIRGLGPIETARPGQITHLSRRAYRPFLATTRASAVLLAEADAGDCPAAAVVVVNPYLAFALVSQLFDDAPRQPPGVHAAADVDASARVHPAAAVAARATVAADAVIGAGAQVGPGAHVGRGSVVGGDSVVHANATLYHGGPIGTR